MTKKAGPEDHILILEVDMASKSAGEEQYVALDLVSKFDANEDQCVLDVFCYPNQGRRE